MARFSGTVANAAPLIIQVRAATTGTGSYCSLFAIKVAGQSSSGSASRPTLFRPATPGTGTGQTPELRSRVPATAGATLLTSFTANPSLPTVNLGSFNLPIRVGWMMSPRDGVVFANNGAVVLYQNASGGHTIEGSVSWEEM